MCTEVESKFIPKYREVNVCKITRTNGLRKINVNLA